MNPTTDTFERFVQDLIEIMTRLMEIKYHELVEAQARMVNKTNGPKLGISITFDNSTVAPTVYPEEAFKAFKSGEKSLEEIGEEMADFVHKAHETGIELPELTAEEARKHVTLTLVNTELNRALLEKVPHFEICSGELAAIPRWYIREEASFVVTNDIAGQLQLTPDEILQIGKQHINEQHFEAKPMMQVLAEMMGGEVPELFGTMDDGPQMIVVSSENKLQGAAALLSEETLNRVHELIGGDYVVLPSSIHEVICIPVTRDMNPEELRRMVHEVNTTQVSPEERLSESIFRYDGHKLTLVGDSLKIDTPSVDIPKQEVSRKLSM